MFIASPWLVVVPTAILAIREYNGTFDENFDKALIPILRGSVILVTLNVVLYSLPWGPWNDVPVLISSTLAFVSFTIFVFVLNVWYETRNLRYRLAKYR